MVPKDIILVCTTNHPRTNLLLRAGAIKAQQTGLPWYVLSIEPTDKNERNSYYALRFQVLAKKMGATLTIRRDKKVLRALFAFLKTLNESNIRIQHLIIGKEKGTYGFFFFTQSFTKKLRRYASVSHVLILPLVFKRPKLYNWQSLFFDSSLIRKFALVLAINAFVTLSIKMSIAWGVEFVWLLKGVEAYIFINGLIALKLGFAPAFLSSILGFLDLYYFVSPNTDFTLVAEEYAVLIAALLLSYYCARSRAQNIALNKKKKEGYILYMLNHEISQLDNPIEIFRFLHDKLSRLYKGDFLFFTPASKDPSYISLSYPKNYHLSEEDLKVVKECWQHARLTGLGSYFPYQSSWCFEPILTSTSEIGILGIKLYKNRKLDLEQGQFLSSLADQVANVLERVKLKHLMQDSRLREEREKLRSNLLSSISHDLKTPLASIIGSLKIYQKLKGQGRLKKGDESELIETAVEEAERLNSSITNILEMTRLESGEIKLNKEWYSPEEAINHVKKRLAKHLTSHVFSVQRPSENMEIRIDILLIEQVLQNILENAIKYTPPHSKITVSMGINQHYFYYEVKDSGPGIPEEQLVRIFDKFKRLELKDRKVAGTGLGLATSRSIIQIHSGKIEASNNQEGGACFTIYLPEFRRNEGL